MKELSIEEKAARYDEASKWMENAYPTLSHEQQMEAEVFFPMFKESEDEKVRKSIIGFLITISSLKDGKTVSNEDFDSKVILEWVAWLEKQGEQKPINNQFTPKQADILNKHIDKFLEQKSIDEIAKEVCKDKASAVAFLKKVGIMNENGELAKQYRQDEQKQDTDFSDLRTWKYIVDAVWTEKEGIGQYLDSPFTEEVAKKLQKRFGNFEQKPVEEITSNPDYISPKDKALFEIATVLSQHEDKDSSPLEEIRSILVNYGINNSESNEQKPAWSEEDEKLQSKLIRWQEEWLFSQKNGGYMDNGNLIKSIEESISWLKSLKERFTWKPSEEQMKALNEAVYHVDDSVATQIAMLIGELSKL